MADKKEVYKWVKIGGLLSYIPVVLATGVIGGYFAGRFIEIRFMHSKSAAPICAGIGLAASIIEVIRIIRITLKIENKE